MTTHGMRLSITTIAMLATASCLVGGDGDQFDNTRGDLACTEVGRLKVDNKAAARIAKADGDWYFRGTPNGWATTAMTRVGTGETYEICQHFAGVTDPRFKIDRYGDWYENYPDQDYRVSDNASYRIIFDAQSRQITTDQVVDCDGNTTPPTDSWYFRGTPNDWGTTLMDPVEGTQRYQTCQTFSGISNPRFKVDHHGDWMENYPAQDYAVQDGSYLIMFDAGNKQITADSVNECGGTTTPPPPPPPPVDDSWYFRGTANGWCSTPMTQVEGTNQHTLTVQFAREDPSPRFKVDHYGDWTDNYPNEDYVVEDCSEYEITFDATSMSLSAVKLADIDTGSCAATSPPPPPPPGGKDFREESIYFVMTTRFYDGDSSNNYYNRDRLEIGDPHWRGDFRGLIDHLDYIQDLGFTAIWVTPPVENRSGLDYHGYHAYDWTVVDPRLESPGASYKDFIDAAHARGIKVIQDVVVNHSSQYGIRGEVWIDHLPIKYYRPAGGGAIDNGPYQGNLGDYQSPFREDNDNPIAPVWFRERASSDPEGTVPLLDPLTGATVPSPGYDPNRFFGIDAQGLDSDWYHLDGFMSGGDWENPTALQNKHMAGDTIDLATGRPNVKNYINGAIEMYLDMGVDAIRLDTAKHVERNELLTYVNEWQSYKPGTFVFGEVLVKGTGWGSEIANDNASAVIRPWWYTRVTGEPGNPNGGGYSGLSVLDFSLFSTFRDNVTNGSFGGIGGILSMDWVYGDATQLVTFFQNHDVGPDNDFKYRFGGEAWKAAITYNLLWTVRGIPSLYYGEEIQFMAGAPQDIQGNDMKVSETGRAYFGDRLDPGAIATTKSHPLWRHVQRLNQIRRAIPALQKAPMSHVNEFGSGLSFVRDYNNGESYADVGLATGSGQSFSVSGVRNGTYRDAVTGNTIDVTGGTISFSVREHSAGIYILNGPGKIGQDGVFLR